MVNHSTLEQHKFKKGKFITPFNDALGDKLQLSSWGSERLPEYLWIGLILKNTVVPKVSKCAVGF